MEKIYMEESKKQKKSVMNLSVALSFVVSVFAVFSLALYGIIMNQGTGISYAADEQEETFKITTKSYVGYAVAESSQVQQSTPMMNVNNYYKHADGATAAIELKNQAFCIERKYKTVDEDSYGTTETVRSGQKDFSNDSGLIYLLSLGKKGSSITGKGAAADGYVLQSAIWYYLYKEANNQGAYAIYDTNYTPTGSTQVLNDLTVMNTDNIVIQSMDDLSAPFIKIEGFKSKVQELYNKAKAAVAPNVSVSVADGKSTLTDDKKFYQSPLITVVGTPAESFDNYSVKITGIDDMTVVNENGQEISKDAITAGTKFYVRIPAEKVTKESQTVKIDVEANFQGTGVSYNISKSDDATHQRLGSLSAKPISSGAEFVVTPDTGMNVAQTIYFVGLIVLLCGVGIVYANAKPVEAKQ